MKKMLLFALVVFTNIAIYANDTTPQETQETKEIKIEEEQIQVKQFPSVIIEEENSEK